MGQLGPGPHRSGGIANELGGSIVDPAVDVPYGVLATVADRAGAVFELRTSPQG